MPYCIFTVIWVADSRLVACHFLYMAFCLWYKVSTQASAITPNFQSEERSTVTSLSDMYVLKVLCACGHTLPGPGSVAGYNLPSISPKGTE